MRRLQLLFVIALCAGVACAPSIRAVQRSDAYFEQCYSADFDTQLGPSERRSCWEAWLLHYGEGQPPHRLTYASDRLAAIGRGEGTPVLPGMTGGGETSDLRTVLESSGVELAPAEETMASNPVATTAPTDDTGPSPRVPPPPAPNPPRFGNPACGQVCDPRWVDCEARCDRAHPDACLRACQAEHRTCMRACF